jgi:hypothetical protein
MAKQSRAPQSPSRKLSREEELRKLSRKELTARYLATYQKDADPEATDEDLVTDILAASPEPPATRMPATGAEETEKVRGTKKVKNKAGQEFEITPDLQDKVVIWQEQVQMLNGGLVGIPNTDMLQSYDPAYFTKLLKDNFFGESKMRIEILHDPR